MPPKATVSNPLRNVVEIVTETKQTRRGLQTTEKEVPFHSLKDNKMGDTSRSKSQVCSNAARGLVGKSAHISSDDAETISLRHVDTQEDIVEDTVEDRNDGMDEHVNVEEEALVQEMPGQGNVCAQIASYIVTSDHLKTPMDQWICDHSRYLHILLEMEGVTKAPQCSICSEAMAIKCDGCIAGNYFCVACCLPAHKRSPFHRTFHWTGSHFHQCLCIHWGSSYVLSMRVNCVL
jgi:hypothetical protein